MIPWLDNTLQFPALSLALREPNGLLAAGGDLSPRRVLAAYAEGIFPWFMPGEPILWWSPDPRMVLFPEELHIPKSLDKVLRNRPYDVRFDTAFDRVMQGCAAPRDGEPATWISDEIRASYGALHRGGWAHSAECWMDGELAGGLYGIAIGKMFYGESMFARKPDASKIAFVHLVRYLHQQGFELIDCQMRTDHLARFGAREILRDEFIERLKRLTPKEHLAGPWTYQYRVEG
ncbi:leucyl/phenylalanyl-tRNA--protein transferase [Iodobacter fluviatilis]|uniref:Leucyl/phenylalanyl-tRNA--protein transferase n=1 Tax=Iodobacter fluviatilis TaxID=537 RepID=A0A377Q3V3_9NEIS|nr:leucyl/phenylalanyl-tRNA--protein transferase [Iodobacter fluviatilis]TCU84491.1 leucyl/phenylalanyl-tRNA--protein transferase [Iodobacter fluviatilis]STQ89956.1 Leucyl/phenylalanyl-tRNA--protein transferase [Iodobacter fluviatilis]